MKRNYYPFQWVISSGHSSANPLMAPGFFCSLSLLEIILWWQKGRRRGGGERRPWWRLLKFPCLPPGPFAFTTACKCSLTAHLFRFLQPLINRSGVPLVSPLLRWHLSGQHEMRRLSILHALVIGLEVRSSRRPWRRECGGCEWGREH